MRLQAYDRPTHLHAGRGQARADGLEVRLLAKVITRAAHKQQRLMQLNKRRVPQALLRAAKALSATVRVFVCMCAWLTRARLVPGLCLLDEQRLRSARACALCAPERPHVTTQGQAPASTAHLQCLYTGPKGSLSMCQ